MLRPMFLIRRFKRTSRGQSLVETAFVLPILVIMLLFAIDLGRVFFTTIDMRNAAHEATMVGSTDPEAPCAELKDTVDREMHRTGADGAVCGALGTSTNIAYITENICERADAGKDCTPWDPNYEPTADLRYAVKIEMRFQPVVPLVGFLTGNGIGGSVPLAAENRSQVLVGYEGS